MKTILKILFLSGLIGITAFSCRKEKIKPQHNSNITLYDKPLAVIQANIMGKWKLQYEKGGICASCVNDNFNNIVWEFTDDNKIKQSYNDTLVNETIIIWTREKDIFTDLTFIMNFYDNSFIVCGIHNDTLVLSDNSYDPVSYHFTRSN